jgi:5-methylcytosine-specific restriction endonuclease McrA
MSPPGLRDPIKKICTSCLKVKSLTDFYKDSKSEDGYRTRCKVCHAKAVKKWQTNNPAKFKEVNKKWKKAHKEKRAEESKEWAKSHPMYRREVGEKWRTEHPDYGKNWRKNNRDKIKIYAQSRRARIVGNGGDLTLEEWYAILDFYGHKCLCCGRDDVKLTIDHVVPIFQGGKHSADNVQPLCGPCNSRKKDKHIDYRKEYFHETPRN